MSSLFVPFDHRPVATIPKSNAGYTVPAGKYARISGTITVVASANGTSNNGTQFGVAIQSQGSSVPFSFWLTEGDVVTIGSDSASGSFSSTVQTSGFSDARILINSVIVARVYASASGGYGIGSGTVTVSGSISGGTTINYLVEEYLSGT